MANPVKAAFKFGRGTVTRTVDGNTVSRARTGGYVLRPKSTVHTKDGGGRNLSRTVVGGGMTEAGKNITAVLGAGGVGAAGYAHGRHYVPRKQTRTVKVKVKKRSEPVGISAFGVEHPESIAKKAPGERHPALRPSVYNSRKQNVRGAMLGGALTGAAIGTGVGLASKAPSKGTAALAGVGTAAGVAHGALTGAMMTPKDGKGAAALRRLHESRYANRQAYKKGKKDATARYHRDLSKGLFPGPLPMAEQLAAKARPKKTVRAMLAEKSTVAPKPTKPYKKPTPTAHDMRRSFGL